MLNSEVVNQTYHCTYCHRETKTGQAQYSMTFINVCGVHVHRVWNCSHLTFSLHEPDCSAMQWTGESQFISARFILSGFAMTMLYQVIHVAKQLHMLPTSMEKSFQETVGLGTPKKDGNKLLASNAVHFCIPNSH